MKNCLIKLYSFVLLNHVDYLVLLLVILIHLASHSFIIQFGHNLSWTPLCNLNFKYRSDQVTLLDADELKIN